MALVIHGNTINGAIAGGVRVQGVENLHITANDISNTEGYGIYVIGPLKPVPQDMKDELVAALKQSSDFGEVAQKQRARFLPFGVDLVALVVGLGADIAQITQFLDSMG